MSPTTTAMGIPLEDRQIGGEKSDHPPRDPFSGDLDHEPLLESETDSVSRTEDGSHPSLAIAIWIGFSVMLTFFNKHILTQRDFPYPIFLTALHMSFITLGARLVDGVQRYAASQPAQEISWAVWSRTILPISVLFSASLMLSNVAFVHLDVSVIQMLKALTPIVTLVIQLVVGLRGYNHGLLFCILLPTFGALLAARMQRAAPIFGLLCQAGAVLAESGRMIVAQVTLAQFGLTPSSCIKMYAPVCAGLSLCMVPLTEGVEPLINLHKAGLALLALNALVAWGLNMASLGVIQAAGSLTLSLFGYVKDATIIFISVLFLGSYVSPTQWLGYLLTLLGAATFKVTGGDMANVRTEVLLAPLARARERWRPRNASANLAAV